MVCKGLHRWYFTGKTEVAYFSKRDLELKEDPGAYKTVGQIDKCERCGELRIRPLQPNLRPVAVTQTDEQLVLADEG